MASQLPRNPSDISNSINVISYNMHGFNQGALLLNSLCNTNNYDVLFLQEHWLSTDLMRKFDCFKQDYCVYGISAMDTSISQGILRGRPRGGVLTLIRKSLCNAFNRVVCVACAERYTIVSLDDLLLVNVYLPTCRSESHLDELRSILGCICSDIGNCKYSHIIFGDDINCNVLHNSSAAKVINSILNSLGLVICNALIDIPCPFDYTFAAESRGAYSIIDHFFVTDTATNFVQSLDVIHDADNLSDHLPLKLELNMNILDFCHSISKPSNKNSPAAINKALNWLEANKAYYYELTRIELVTLHSLVTSETLSELQVSRPDLFTQAGINDIYRNVVHVLLNSALKAVPLKSKPAVRKHWWDKSLSNERNNSVVHHANWVAAGRPKHGGLFVAKNLARAKYKKHIAKKKSDSKNIISEKLQHTLMGVNKNKFWRLWKANFKPAVNTGSMTVNNLKDDNDISNHLAESFSNACTPNDINRVEDIHI